MIFFMQSQTHLLLPKTFVFEQEGSSKSDNIEVTLGPDLNTSNLKYVINIWKHKNQIKGAVTFRIYDSVLNRYAPLDLEAEDNQKYLYSSVVMIKYREEGASTNGDDEVQSISSFKDSSFNKRERNKERNIEQVLRCVKQWRALHNTLDKNRGKINLQEAAKLVGVSKKSLDDYYCQLRLAEEYGFDFQSNIHENIGVLRTFVKGKRPKDYKNLKHQKLPKRLRVLEEIDIDEVGSKFKESYKTKIQTENIPQSGIQTKYEPPLSIIPEDDYENRFYSSFDFRFDEPQDPFVSLGRKNVQKQLFSDSDQLLF